MARTRRRRVVALALASASVLSTAAITSAHDPEGRWGAHAPVVRAHVSHDLLAGPMSRTATLAPTRPVLDDFSVVGHLDVGGRSWSGDVFWYDHGPLSGKFAYVGNAGRPCTGRGIDIIDVSDPSDPVRVAGAGRHEGVSNEDVVVRRIGTRDILGVGVQICGESGRAGLALFDVTDPTDPHELSFLAVPAGGVHELDMVVRPDGRALALMAVPFSEFDDVWFGAGTGGDFRIADITDPEEPQEIADWGIVRDSDMRIPGGNDPISSPFQGIGNFPSFFAHSARAANGGMRAYVSYWDAGVLKFDISDPDDPQLLAHTLFPETESGDTHSLTPYDIGGRRYLLANQEDSDPAETALLYELGDIQEPEDETAGHPIVDLRWLPTTLADRGELIRRVVDANDGCQRSDFDGSAGKFVLVDTVDPFYVGIIDGWEVPCGITGQALRAARAGAGAVVFNLISPDDAYEYGPRTEQQFEKVQERAGEMPAVMISDIDEVAQRIRDRLDDGRDERLLLRPTEPSYGYLRVYAEGSGQDVDGDGITDYGQVGAFAGLPHVQGDGTPPFGEWTIHNTEVLGDRAYMSWYSNGIVALDVADPARPRYVGRFVPAFPGTDRSFGMWGVAVDPETNLVYASDIDQGLWILRPRGEARALP